MISDNYIIATPDRKKDKHLVHVNFTKEYCQRHDDVNDGAEMVVSPVCSGNNVTVEGKTCSHADVKPI